MISRNAPMDIQRHSNTTKWYQKCDSKSLHQNPLVCSTKIQNVGAIFINGCNSIVVMQKYRRQVDIDNENGGCNMVLFIWQYDLNWWISGKVL